MTLLLDTCAAIWTADPDMRFRNAQPRIEAEIGEQGRVFVSPITAWEIGQLVARGRLALIEPPADWFAALLDRGVELAPMTPEILIDASFLPHSPLRDPADKIIAATARRLGHCVVTRDQALLAYAQDGWMSALAC